MEKTDKESHSTKGSSKIPDAAGISTAGATDEELQKPRGSSKTLGATKKSGVGDSETTLKSDHRTVSDGGKSPPQAKSEIDSQLD